MLLIHPPCAKACEPPAGIARLAGALTAHDIPHRLWDANLEGQLWLLEQPPTATDIWTKRAWRNREANLAALRDAGTYGNPGRYATAVNDLNRLLTMGGRPFGATPALADYRHALLSPLRSNDLLAAAAQPEQNPFYPFFRQRLKTLLDGIQTVGISLTYLSQALCGFALIGLVRQLAPGVTIILGGGLVTSWLQRPDWQNPFGGLVDNLIAGPGERALLALYGQQPSEPAAPPDYDQFPLHDYLAPGPVIPYSAAAGCWWNRCSFCPERAEGNRWQPLSQELAVRQLHDLSAHYRPALLHITDNAISPALLKRLAEHPLHTPWYGFARFDGQLADPQFCNELRRSGCVLLKLGLESGSQKVLDSLRKGIDLEIAAQALENLKSAGIAVYCYLLFGTPAEDEEAARQTLDFTARHAGSITFLNLAIFNMPLFGDEAELHGTGLFYEGDLSFYTGFRHPAGWERGAVRRFLEQEFKRHPAIAAIVKRDPPVFTSNHAPFFYTEDKQ